MVKTNIIAPDFLKGEIATQLENPAFSLYNKETLTAFPSFCDVHVHLREPGFSYKETIKTGTLSASRGGFTSVCSMPNLNPVPDSEENLQAQLDLIKENAVISVYPYASITLKEKGDELVDISTLSKNAVAFSDDGRGVQDDKMMEDAMLLAKANGKIIAAHCEVNALLKGGYIHDGEYAKAHGHRGICSESEYAQIERDLNLAKKTGVKYHVCHISTKESVSLIRQAKKDGVDVTCETGPHYLILSDSDLQEHGRFKMNPPLRSVKDKEALIEGVVDGTIDIIATDHAPHSQEEKSKGLEKSAFGVVGLETSFSASYTHLVKTGIISLEKLVQLMAINPRERFNIPYNGFTVFDLENSYTVNPSDFLSLGKATPFENMNFYGICYLTALNGKVVYKI
ncbi:MAG: dihydroorotase [Clostridia bacterium]|nr:dihydroorotase [Clostridia bacterium]